MRATRGALVDERQHLRGVDRAAERRQPLGDAVHPRRPLLPKLAEQVAEPLRFVVEEVAEDVDLAAGLVGVDLDPGDDLERGSCRAASIAGVTASTESWSVTASTRTPRRAASRTSSAGA